MNKIKLLLLSPCILLLLTACGQSSNKVLFDGKDGGNWQTKGAVTIKDNTMTLAGNGSAATLKKGTWQDFELSLRMRTVTNGKGYIAFHTDNSGKGYRVAVNNDVLDPVWWKMTGSLLSVRNLTKSLAKDGEWFDLSIRVEGKAVTVKVNNTPVVEYIEPTKPYRVSPNEKSLLSQGTIALVNTSEGTIEFEKIAIEKLDPKTIHIPAQQAAAIDETTDPIIRLHQEDFPALDYHVHLKGGLTKEGAMQQSRQYGINYAIAPNCGIGFPITNDAEIYSFLDSMRNQPFILAMQGEGREWVTTFSPEARSEFDFVFTDALTFKDHKNRRTRLWIDKEVFIDNEQRYMDVIVDRTCKMLTEPVDVFVNPFFLPTKLNDRYDKFWTDKRIDKVIAAIVKNGKALEINELYNIPSKKIILKAKAAGIKFTFGSNNTTPDFGKLEYSLKMKTECGITAQDMYKPKIKL